MPETKEITAAAAALVRELRAAGKYIATAESCTGGWIAKALTDISGSSECFGYGIVSYAYAAKEELLQVSADDLQQYGAVSEQVVRQMALGVMALSKADYAIAVSGVAGPGDSENKPAGMVWFSWAVRGVDGIDVATSLQRFAGDRDAVRAQSVIMALQGIRERLNNSG